MQSIVRKAKGAVDLNQFIRFFFGGVAGAAANLSCFALARPHVTYTNALAAGVVGGFVVSFLMSKLFAFQSRSLSRSHAELARFIVVYLFGVGCHLIISSIMGHHILRYVMPQIWAERSGVVCGMASMLITSYFGHRYFTYRHVLAGEPAA